MSLDAIASPEMGEASPLIYEMRGKKFICGNQTISWKNLYRFNTLAPEYIFSNPTAQREPNAELQTWGYDESSGVLVLLFRGNFRLSYALSYCDTSTLETTINRHDWAHYKEYFQDRTMRIVSEPNAYDQIDPDTNAKYNPGRRWINEYLKQGYIWVPNQKCDAMLHVEITDQNHRDIEPFLQCVVLAISEVEEQWSGRPKIDEVHSPIPQLPDVALPASLRHRIFVYCMYGGVWAGWPARTLLVPLTAPLGMNWFWRTIWITCIQYAYKGWKRYRIYRFEKILFIEESQLAHDNAVYLLNRRALSDEIEIRPTDDFKKQEHRLDAEKRMLMFDQKDLELRKRNFFITNLHLVGRKKRQEIRQSLTTSIRGFSSF